MVSAICPGSSHTARSRRPQQDIKIKEAIPHEVLLTELITIRDGADRIVYSNLDNAITKKKVYQITGIKWRYEALMVLHRRKEFMFPKEVYNAIVEMHPGVKLDKSKIHTVSADMIMLAQNSDNVDFCIYEDKRGLGKWVNYKGELTDAYLETKYS